MSELSILGLKELDAALQELPAKLEKNILRGAMRAGAKVMLDAARQQVPVRTGALRDSLTVRSGYQRGRVTGTVRAGNSKVYYAHMVEFGTAKHFIKPKTARSLFIAGLFRDGVDHPGARSRPFMRPAFDSSSPAAIEAMAEYLRERIPKEFAKAGL